MWKRGEYITPDQYDVLRDTSMRMRYGTRTVARAKPGTIFYDRMAAVSLSGYIFFGSSVNISQQVHEVGGSMLEFCDACGHLAAVLHPGCSRPDAGHVNLHENLHAGPWQTSSGAL